MNEHTQFKIDTSGGVERLNDWTGHTKWRWSDLSPFQQGAVEAALRELRFRLRAARHYDAAKNVRFDRLTPATLQRIMADCERQAAAAYSDRAPDRLDGEIFWEARQAGRLRSHGFPPLTTSLAEDGLIHLSEVGE